MLARFVDVRLDACDLPDSIHMSVEGSTARPTTQPNLNTQSMKNYWSSADGAPAVCHDYGRSRWIPRRPGRNTRNIRYEHGEPSST